MMLFVSIYPNSENEKDGMVQRIKAIDDAYSDIERTYLDISFRKNLIKSINQHGLVTVYQLNLFIHSFDILQLMITAKIIYVHSVYNAIKVLPAYFFKNTKIITDMHGVVPEELFFSSNSFKARIYEMVEKVVIHRSWKIISVTNQMCSHFASKYCRDTSQDLVIPIFNPIIMKDHQNLENKHTNKMPLVIYAGGIQKWQNVPLMIDAVKNNRQVRYRFLTGNPVVMKRMATSVGLDALDIQSVSAERVFDHYLEADYGFLLREDHLLNRVACPTKAIEYMATGVIPIVLCDEIGDLNVMGYRYVTLDCFLNGILPEYKEIKEMRKTNAEVIFILTKQMHKGIIELRMLTDTF